MNLFNFDAFGPGVGYLLIGFALLFVIVGVIVVAVAVASTIVLSVLLKKKKRLNDAENKENNQ
ncbi:MAG: hypothetical protein Q3987_08215 [Oscillospiraceae bacterium]|nr:hypothetical protein [Oscillospiraceae bacterium]